jgi:pentatricopeptide repeat protein
MSYPIKIFISVVLMLIACVTWYPWKTLADQYHQKADTYWNQAQKLKEQEHYREAVQFYEKSVEAEQASPQPRVAYLANEFGIAGYCYKQMGQYEKALEYYEQSLEIARKMGQNTEIVARLNNIGMVYKAWGQYDKAIDYYEQALKICRQIGKETFIAVLLNNIGSVYDDRGQYTEALDYYQQALEIDQRLGRKAETAIRLNNIGLVYNAWGQYDRAIEYFEQSLEIDRRFGRKSGIAVTLNNIGEVYRMWGQYTKALDYYERSLEMEKEVGRDAEIAIRLSNIGEVHSALRQYVKALKYYEQVLKLDRKFGRNANIARDLNNIGAIYKALGQDKQAIEYYMQALQLQLKLDMFSEIAMSANNIGMIYAVWELYDDALVFYKQALTVARKLGEEASIAAYLHNIGVLYYDQEEYTEAIPHFVESVDLLEKIRKTATGDVRRDYLASQIATYQYLISCYVRIGDFENAFKIIELSRAKRLEEQLAGVGTELSIPLFETIQQSLPEDMAILIYANTVDKNMVQMLMTKEQFTASECLVDEFVQKLITPDQIETATAADSRGLTIGPNNEQSEEETHSESPSLDFTTLIIHYRMQLVTPSFRRDLNLQEQKVASRQENSSKDTVIPNLNKHLYAFLFENIQEHLQGKTRLLILPDGMLNFLPFETLVDKQGKYLVETYQIAYTQSLGVLNLLEKREYKPDRKPLLAFGGAVYEEHAYQEDMIENEAQLVYLQKQVELALKRGSSLREVYTQLGRGDWENLPGTLVEVNAIQDVVEGAELVTGADVNETTVKALSAHGQLANYKILHFATHGAVDPVIPDLSALVLSLPGSTGISPTSEKRADKISSFSEITPTPNPSRKANNTPLSPLEGGIKGGCSSRRESMPAVPGEDGYLRVGEIVNLDLKADFVNLSACETGLGKLYSGEGVVGLTQAFLLAGANGLSVSLWSVADESTAQFMVAVYTLVEKEGLSYTEAITEVKRRFIHGDFGDAWKTPYFWAPFVYYGK